MLRALADEQLTVPEAAKRVNAELGYPGRLGAPPVHAPYIAYQLKKMLAAESVARVPEMFKNKLRYRYFRKAAGEAEVA